VIPPAWHFALLALCAYRIFRLVGYDSLVDRPRNWALKRVGDKLELFITCPFCAGFWISGLVYACWVWLYGDLASTADLLVGAAIWFALSGAVALITTNLDPEND